MKEEEKKRVAEEKAAAAALLLQEKQKTAEEKKKKAEEEKQRREEEKRKATEEKQKKAAEEKERRAKESQKKEEEKVKEGFNVFVLAKYSLSFHLSKYSFSFLICYTSILEKSCCLYIINETDAFCGSYFGKFHRDINKPRNKFERIIVLLRYAISQFHEYIPYNASPPLPSSPGFSRLLFTQYYTFKKSYNVNYVLII